MNKSKHIDSLTIFRFIAAFYVFIFHCNIIFNVSGHVPSWVYMILRNGAIGMTFFFVLSGFVMTLANRDGIVDNYFRKRFMRIYPAYLLMGFLTIPLLSGFGSGKALSVLGLFLTGTQSWYSQSFSVWNFSGSWSVSTELFFYITFPFLFDIIKKHPVSALVISYIASSSIIPISIALNGSDMMPAYYMSPMHRMPEFIFGISLGFIFLNETHINNKKLLFSLIAISIYLLCTYVTISNKSYMLNNNITVPATGVIILCMASLNIRKTLFTKPFIYLGEISYSFYLMYIPLALYVRKYKSQLPDLSNMEYWVVMFIVNLLMAIISYELIEKRFSFKRKSEKVRA